ncbi:Predicted metal-dependent phosphohydrolase, HD superfamily [Prosthecobacter debontii]|uniref:Predicted metal-dependent phosphohydrolase, HD superfamily n=1 Tax=Prosthecobacter debontii TaxID=48467 RepID=A0A1T4WVM9_9BACT|nr:hypothetical protein [Prosthecobacter debontii]SKA80925.1 Predicted metal-dependent phosphohydrolase, HD superfamily [Prosthecobacter debontii]
MASSSQPYEFVFAERVARILERGHVLAYGHRDYCGMGLTYHEGRFYYGEVWDGQLLLAENMAQCFESREAFSLWLGSQSDASLSRQDKPDSFYHDNQTLSRARLMDFVERYESLSRIDLQRWIQLWGKLGVKQVQEPCFGGLCAAYSEPRRAYHNLHHLEACLKELDGVHDQAQQPAILETALWFHDAIYDPQTTSKNEELSANWARDVLEEADAPKDLIKQVRRLILLTKQHVPDKTPDAGLMCDIDLAILGQPEECFWAYERAIRQEYGWVNENEYRQGRIRVLETFLNRKSIYVTELFADRYEAVARSNLKASLERLAGK